MALQNRSFPRFTAIRYSNFLNWYIQSVNNGCASLNIKRSAGEALHEFNGQIYENKK